MVDGRNEIRLEHRPFDAHVHVRNPRSPIFNAVLPLTAQSAGGAVFMPNTVPFITTPEMAKDYEAAIREVTGSDFVIVTTGYLMEEMTPQVIDSFCNAGVRAMKAYPRGATTNTHGGIASFRNCRPALEQMEARGMRLLVHPEQNVTESGVEVDPYDREKRYLENVLIWLMCNFPKLKICVEHVTDRMMAEFLLQYGGDRLACTVTAHHPHYHRGDFFRNGPDVHLHCWPIAKREEDMYAIRRLMTMGKPFVFAGTDTAPHPTHAKEKACGRAGGVFTAHAWLSLYAEVFRSVGTFPHEDFEAFMCLNGPRFYGLEPVKGVAKLIREDWKVENLIDVADGSTIFPFGYHPDPKERTVFRWKLAA